MPQLILFGLPPALPDERGSAIARAFGAYLSEHLGAPVETQICANYSELSDRLAEGKLDFAWLPPLPAAGLRRHCGIDILTHAVRSGLDAYYSVIFARDDSAIRTSADLRGRAVAFVHRRSASGFLVAAARLREMGIELKSPPEFLMSHAAVVRAVALGQADAGATYCSFRGEPERGDVASAGWLQIQLDQPMRVVMSTGPIPADVVCAWPGTSQALRGELSDLLVAMAGDEAGLQLLGGVFGAERMDVADVTGIDRLDLALEAHARAAAGPDQEDGR